MAQFPASASQSGTTVADQVSAAPPPPRSTSVAADGASDAGGSTSSYRPPPVQHKRVYQACIPCRRRKVRCDLGSVDNPNDPPCVRCRRESKECYFSATRRKRKTDDATIDSFEDADHDEYILRNGRKRLNTAGLSPTPVIDRRLYSDVPLTRGPAAGPGSGRSQSTRRFSDGRHELSSTGSGAPTGRRGTSEFGNVEPNQPLENFEARQVMRTEVYGPHDALNLLYKAATDNPSHKKDEPRSPQHHHARSGSYHNRLDFDTRSHPRNQPGQFDDQKPLPRENGQASGPIDPELTKLEPSDASGYTEALKVWARFRFVRAGWFTASEAIDYIDYYYEYLSPLTPISPPTFRSPASHPTLLTEEPILTVTLLTIASRYRLIPGPGGRCRSHAIHEQLWTYLRGMIERVVWGQEAFGGGFCGSGADETQSSSTAPWRGLRRGSLRTLGTIESLLILTEWHPRALHFPPSEAIDELLLPMPNGTGSGVDAGEDEDGNQRPSFGGKRIESWLEPAWRSDRMCWMLLSTAMGLAYELGVFDDIDEMLATGAITRPEYEEETYRLRAYRIKRLLLIYLSQLAGRLGWTNMVPNSLRRTDPVVSRRQQVSSDGTTPGTNVSSMSTAFNYIPDLELDDQIIHCWAGISHAMHIGNEKLFRSRKHTTDIIQSGKYIVLLKEFQPMLQDWWKEFERFRLPPHIRHILTIEYEYVRIYVNSLSLQAVVERCTSNASGGSTHGGSVTGQPAQQLSPQTQNYYGKLPLGQLGGFSAEDQEYVREVVNGSRNLLRTVVEGLLPDDYLKHAPVRTYFRIISGAMFLLKTFALGAPRSDVEISIQLMDRTVDALRNCVVDDVHLGIRFADLLESLTSRLRNRFIHAPAAVSATDGRSPTNPVETGVNGAGVNGQGQASHLGAGPDAWAKLRDGIAHAERSSTPVNISATPFDATTGTFPFPPGSASMFGPSTPAGTTGLVADNNNSSGLPGDPSLLENTDWANPGNEMWYLPPGPAFFQNMDNTSVAMTSEGVHVGGLDLLEYMAMDPMDGQFGGIMDGSGF
ncbi:hypothetical protein VTK73DRAFT_887 [Phialemonium thermophilum]|uniref:Zn(2)-C6 fungal-type domain-containing protein n=1 Tax=Phialemonium thermophilum TaxID=223376 RepID=A0ABR3Y4N4_9PEZI